MFLYSRSFIYSKRILFECMLRCIVLNDRFLGWTILLGSILGICVYFYLTFLSPWIMLIIQISAFVAVAAVLLIMAWIGYTLASTPPPVPIEELDSVNFEESIRNEN